MGVELHFHPLPPLAGKFEIGWHAAPGRNRQVLESIRAGQSPSSIWYDWQEGVEKFKKLRAKYLLYP